MKTKLIALLLSVSFLGTGCVFHRTSRSRHASKSGKAMPANAHGHNPNASPNARKD
jgi:hypothetical protein